MILRLLLNVSVVSINVKIQPDPYIAINVITILVPVVKF